MKQERTSHEDTRTRRFKKLLGAASCLCVFAVKLAFATQVAPVLSFPEAGMDDPARYKDYVTRFYRDSSKNAVQIYLNRSTGRVVNLWADTANESVSFTVRNAGLTWCNDSADITSQEHRRFIEFFLCASSSKIEIGHLLLGTMRKERDFQYFKKDLLPFDSEPYLEPELLQLIANLQRLPEQERATQLKILKAQSTEELRSRLEPNVKQNGSTVSVEQTYFDGKNHLWLELNAEGAQLRVDPHGVAITSNSAIRLRVKVGTDSPALTPLDRGEIFNQAFLNFYNEMQSRASASAQAKTEFRWIDREVRGMELVSYHEKLMAGLPNFATYFGRDTMMSAFMFTPIWTDSMMQHSIESVLRKLSPRGEASHEEALGGQAIRENAAEYNKLVEAGSLPEAREILSNLQRVRENYRMIDDDFQLPILIGRFFSSAELSAAQKRAFLVSRLPVMLRNFAYVCDVTRPYVEHPDALHLVSFPKEDGRWLSSSWRDSDPGYAGGRFAMDVNVIFVPNALESIASALQFLKTVGYSTQKLEALLGDVSSDSRRIFLRYVSEPARLQEAIRVWRGSSQHFQVSLSRAEYMKDVQAKIASLPADEQAYWKSALEHTQNLPDHLNFPALSLDENGKPLRIINTDPATLLFLENHTEKILADREQPGDIYQLIDPFLIPYPAGLFIEDLGPVCANDSNASPAVWQKWEKDLYHSPRVVWGREANLFTLGLMKEIIAAQKKPELNTYVGKLSNALEQTRKAVEASGLKHNELWSYEIHDGKLWPIRYGRSSDVQLWNLTDLSIQFLKHRM